MKGVVRSLLLFLCTTLFIMSASVCVCVVRVHADGATYFVVAKTEQDGIIADDSRNYFYQTAGTGEIRSVILVSGNNKRLYSVTNVAGCSVQYHYNNAGNTSSLNQTSDIYYYTYSSSSGTSYNVTNAMYNAGYPVVTVSNINNYNDAIYYTWGQGAVAPVEPVNWGLVDVKGYQTNIAGQGQASINNVDVITWDSAIDTNGNDITTGNVRIRFLPGEYRAETKNNLIQKTYNDFILDVVHATDGNVYPVTNGSASFSWSEVIQTLNLPFMSVYSLINENDAWLKRGWIYEIRLEIDDYIGEWQPIYASTSSGVENDMTIVNTTVITQDTITAIQNINSINSTTNIWIINGQPVNPNPEVTPPADDDEKPWWVYLLEMINNTLGIQNEYINEGTDESIEIVNNFEEDHDDLNVTVNDYDDIENNIVNDMNDNLDDLDIESDLIENNSFLSSARWVAEQYTRITTDNPIGSILKFSLVLGFVMIFLGRFK